jgi:hypothetical protein
MAAKKDVTEMLPPRYKMVFLYSEKALSSAIPVKVIPITKNNTIIQPLMLFIFVLKNGGSRGN